MPLTEKHRGQIIAWFCIIFYVLMVFKWTHGLFLYQLRPAVFHTRFDLTTWLLMETGIHQWLLKNEISWFIFDAAFYTLPLLYWLAYQKIHSLARVVAFVMFVINMIYIQCYTLYPANSIEGFTAWLLFPLLFLAGDLKTFYFILHGLRYFFLFFFASAGLWKLYQQGVFNSVQMSGVLLFQHKEYLASSPNHWYTSFIYWLVNHSRISYLLYVGATILELLFIIGFFTKKYDRLLVKCFLVFILLDIFFMRIHYWEIGAFVLTLLYSRYSIPVTEVKEN